MALFNSFDCRRMMPANTYPWDRDGNLIVPRYGIRIAMALALLTAGAFQWFTFLGNGWWHKHNPEATPTRPEPLWMFVLWLTFPLVPFMISMLLLSRRSEETKAAGAGLAAALFTCGFAFAVAVFLAEFVGFPAPDPYVLENLVVTLVFIFCSAWIIVSAFRIAAKASWGVFFLSAAATLGYAAMANHLLQKTDLELSRRYDQKQVQTLTT